MYSILLCFVWFTLCMIVISGGSSLSNDVGIYCDGTGWIAYRDEKCYKLIKQWTTRDGAKDACAQEESDGSTPLLATIKSTDEQTYLTELVFNTSAVTINVWIGAKRQYGNKFVWDDGSEVGEFTNWAEGCPTDKIQQSCVVMKSEYMKAESTQNTAGQWRDVPCDAPNYVICEKLPRWSFNKLQKALLETRKELKDSNDLLSKELDETRNELSITKNQLTQSTDRLGVAEAKIEETKEKLVPIGFLYTQLPNEKAPSEIWPWMTWADVSSAYAGVFFRVEGGGSASFGQEQPENVPHITRMKNRCPCENVHVVDTVFGGWSEGIFSGDGGDRDKLLCLYYETSDGEVRPRNSAIRVWRRTR